MGWNDASRKHWPKNDEPAKVIEVPAKSVIEVVEEPVKEETKSPQTDFMDQQGADPNDAKQG